MTIENPDEHILLVKKVILILFVFWIYILARICKKCMYKNDPAEHRRKSSLIRSVVESGGTCRVDGVETVTSDV